MSARVRRPSLAHTARGPPIAFLASTHGLAESRAVTGMPRLVCDRAGRSRAAAGVAAVRVAYTNQLLRPRFFRARQAESRPPRWRARHCLWPDPHLHIDKARKTRRADPVL